MAWAMATAQAESPARLPVSAMTKEEISALPLARYPGAVTIPATEAELQAATRQLQQESVLGFDMEARPAFKKGELYPPALLQLAGADRVYLIRLNRLGLTPELRAILADPDILKVGVGAAADCSALQDLAAFEPAGFVNLDDLAKEMGIRRPSLRGLTAVLLKFRISKSAQTSNWEAPELTPGQVSYAATDAWVGREIYRRMQELGYVPASSKDKKSVPKQGASHE